jgi:ESF2/ABP1 family protein
MSTRKHNDFLEAKESDDGRDSGGYNSEEEDLRKGARSSKRRRMSDDESDDDHTDDEFVEPGQAEKSPEPEADNEAHSSGDEDKSASKELKLKREIKLDLPDITKTLHKNLITTDAAIKKSGVVYISRIPPFMKPAKLRSLLEPYGTINRIFMTPEDPLSHSRRVKSGGNKKRSFLDGWIEFTSKRDAKKCVELLNTQVIGGKKGTYYHDDVWNLKYLHSFKWRNLTEQIAAENAARASRLRAEISKTTRENREFVRNVEQAKRMEGMEAKRAAKRAKAGENDVAPSAAPVGDGGEKKEKKGGARPMKFRQTATAPKRAGDQSETVKQVLSKIF